VFLLCFLYVANVLLAGIWLGPRPPAEIPTQKTAPRTRHAGAGKKYFLLLYFFFKVNLVVYVGAIESLCSDFESLFHISNTLETPWQYLNEKHLSNTLMRVCSRSGSRDDSRAGSDNGFLDAAEGEEQDLFGERACGCGCAEIEREGDGGGEEE
jgi:hypothetical protein